MSQLKLPIGLQDFESIRNENYLYIDKTKFIHQIFSQYKYFFLSRPRRFGKSLLVSTLQYLFQGKKELFSGLFIEDKWDFQEFPVIKISFSNIGYREISLVPALNQELKSIAKQYQLTLEKGSPSLLFIELILALREKFNKKVVILIDEYDKPLIDFLDKENLHQAIENRSILKSFYSVLKDADPHLQLVFITGVSKFSQVSIFSDLNNLYDISMLSEYNEICGITQTELETSFVEELKKYDKEEIRRWYNGYRWYPDALTVYNPFSILNFFGSGGDFRNFWYATGTPTFLMKKSREEHFFQLENLSVDVDDLKNFDIENLRLIPVLFQTGYLTIKGKSTFMKNVFLDFPNQEVKESYYRGLADEYIQSQKHTSTSILDEILNAFQEADCERFQNGLNNAFAQIPYDLWQRENEHFYHAIVHLLFSLLGVYVQSEVHTKNGRADVVIHFQNSIYCLEFKLDKTAEEAIEQIKNRGYLEQYAHSKQTLYLIGINFSSANKKVEKVIWETVN